MPLLSGIDWKTVVVAILLMLFAVPFIQKMLSNV